MNVNKVISMVPKLSPFVKMVLVKDGVHDLFLSGKHARQEAYVQMFEWFESVFGGEGE